jgi:hypothetical protein
MSGCEVGRVSDPPFRALRIRTTTCAQTHSTETHLRETCSNQGGSKTAPYRRESS